MACVSHGPEQSFIAWDNVTNTPRDAISQDQAQQWPQPFFGPDPLRPPTPPADLSLNRNKPPSIPQVGNSRFEANAAFNLAEHKDWIFKVFLSLRGDL
jgi:hypothetical protein